LPNPGNFVLFAGLGSVISGIEVTKFYAWQLVLSVVRVVRVVQVVLEEQVWWPAVEELWGNVVIAIVIDNGWGAWKSPATLAR